MNTNKRVRDPFAINELDPALIKLLQSVQKRVVVIGSTARGKLYPKDLDLLYDYNSDRAKKEIERAINVSELEWKSVFIGSWTILSKYGLQVEFLPFHQGADYRVLRRRSSSRTIAGIPLFVAQPSDA